jgi:uncharacterized membrane protein
MINVWVQASIVIFSFPFIVDWQGINGAFITYMVMSLVAILCVTFVLKETKGLSPKEIEKIFDEESNPESKIQKRKDYSIIYPI